MHKILLDLGGVIFKSSGLSNEFIDWKLINQLNHKYGHDLNIGKMTVKPFLAEYNQLTQQSLSIDEFLKQIFDTLSFNQELIDFLTEKGEIYILSDNYRENIDYISERYNFDQWSSKQFYSYDFKITKYDSSKIFGLTLEALGLNPEEVIFIDDSEAKIVNARNLGIKSIQYKNNEQLFKDFSRFFPST